MVNPHVNGYTEAVNTLINAKKHQPTENQKNTINEIKVEGTVFTFQLAVGAICPSAPLLVTAIAII